MWCWRSARSGIVRLIGWDGTRQIHKLRWKAVGGKVTRTGSQNTQMGLTSEETDETVVYARPTLEHFLRCPYCQGFWVSLIVYLCWVFVPTETLYGIAPFALSGAVGIIARMLDP